MSALDYSSCFQCGSSLGCDLDCPNAPWNDGKSSSTPIVHLVRLVRWVRSLSSIRTPIAQPLPRCGRWSRRPHETHEAL